MCNRAKSRQVAINKFVLTDESLAFSIVLNIYAMINYNRERSQRNSSRERGRSRQRVVPNDNRDKRRKEKEKKQQLQYLITQLI